MGNICNRLGGDSPDNTPPMSPIIPDEGGDHRSDASTAQRPPPQAAVGSAQIQGLRNLRTAVGARERSTGSKSQAENFKFGEVILPRSEARAAYEDCRYFHGTTTPVDPTEIGDPSRDNIASLMSFGFDPEHKRKDEINRADDYIKNHLPKLLEQTADVESYIASRSFSHVVFDSDDDETKKSKISAAQDRVREWIKEIHDPEHPRKRMAQAVAEQQRSYFTNDRDMANSYSLEKVRRTGGESQLVPKIIRVLYSPEQKKRIVGPVLDTYIEGKHSSENFRTNRRAGPMKGGEQAYWKTLEARGYRLPTLEDSGEVLDEVGSDLGDDHPRPNSPSSSTSR